MAYEQWVEGFSILAKYPSKEKVLSRYDQVHVFVDPEIVSAEDRKRLHELSWFRADEDWEYNKYFYRWGDDDE